jgi:hypothetical protein
MATIEGIISAASNIVIGDNPAYSVADFLAVYPQFGPADEEEAGPIPDAVLQAYVALASASLSKERWNDLWDVGMSFFIAHFATLYLQAKAAAGSTAAQVAKAGQAKGILVSKSAGDVSGSYQTVVSGWEEWGAWNLTLFGQQLMTMASLVGLGGMYIY